MTLISKRQVSRRLLPIIWACASLWGCTAETGQEISSDSPEAEPTMAVSTPHVRTLTGTLQGVATNEDVDVFRGIPYAQPPTGDLRWRPPQAPRPWEGIRDASAFSVSCPQPRFTSEYVWRREDFATAEDCLYLNVWRPEGADNMPVMVWFHGGAHTAGQGHSKIFDGTTIAQNGAVLVSINYRLGALGFLAHPWLSDESDHASSGNYGLLDKIAALNWVRDNIAEFGGNPDNVTIFGQSAGSQSVCSLMASPLARGLFHKAIGQSAACIGPAPQRDPGGLERGQRLVAELGVKRMRFPAFGAVLKQKRNGKEKSFPAPAAKPRTLQMDRKIGRHRHHAESEKNLLDGSIDPGPLIPMNRQQQHPVSGQ